MWLRLCESREGVAVGRERITARPPRKRGRKEQQVNNGAGDVK